MNLIIVKEGTHKLGIAQAAQRCGCSKPDLLQLIDSRP